MNSTTFQSVQKDSAEFPKFLRKAIKQDAWRCFASDATSWNLKFRRTIKGAVGEPDVDVEVQTDINVGLSGKFGSVQSFHDSQPVEVRKPSSLHLSETDTTTLCQLFLKFPAVRLSIHCSSGSTHSSKYGLSFYSLEAHDRDARMAVEIGGTSVCNGEVLVCAAVNVGR